jgi:transcriptional antiterminator NusG
MAAVRWYVINTLSGHEQKVAEEIAKAVAQQGLSAEIEEVLVPSEQVVEVRKGRKVASNRKFFPGYVLVKMNMTDRAWHLVKNINRVAGFLGGQGRPQPISDREAQRILQQVEEGVTQAAPTVMFDTGESVKVIDGPFESFIGVVEEVDYEKQRLKVSVSIFGRATPVELEFTQVEKVK